MYRLVEHVGVELEELILVGVGLERAGSGGAGAGRSWFWWGWGWKELILVGLGWFWWGWGRKELVNSYFDLYFIIKKKVWPISLDCGLPPFKNTGFTPAYNTVLTEGILRLYISHPINLLP